MTDRPRLAVVVPVFHNAESLPLLHQRLVALEESHRCQVQVIYVDDRSRDDSYQTLQRLAASDERARVIRLARNFGSFTAIRAGLDHLEPTDCVAIISADLQDPPEHLGAMLESWRAGNQVVLAVRRSRADNLSTRICSAVYYFLMRRLALPEMPRGGFDFLLMDWRVAHVLRQFQESNTSLMGLVLWMGFQKALLPYDRAERPFGRSMWKFARKMNYFIDSFVAFTAFPLRLASAAGVSISALSFGWCGFVICQAVIFGRPLPGWTSLMASVCFLGGVQLLCLGIIGEYLWRNLEESRKRPLYIVDEAQGTPVIAPVRGASIYLRSPATIPVAGHSTAPSCPTSEAA